MNHHALIVGVESYRDRLITPVHFAQRDAAGWAELLRGTCRFDRVRVLAGGPGEPDEPTQRNVFDALNEFARAVESGDHFVFIFAGHGLEESGRGYLLLSDFPKYTKAMGCLSLDVLRADFLERMSARWCTVLLDSCRNDPEAARGEGAGSLGSTFYRDFASLGDRRRSAGGMTSLLSACGPGQRAHASEAHQQGIWSHFLHEGIRGGAWKNGVLRLRELAAYARARVIKWSESEPGLRERQEPWIQQWGSGDDVELARSAEAREAEPGRDEVRASEVEVEPLPPGAFAWFHGTPRHLSRIALKCPPVVWVEGCPIEFGDAGRLVRQGVARTGVRRGRPSAEVELEALLAGGQFELLDRWAGREGADDRISEAMRMVGAGDFGRAVALLGAGAGERRSRLVWLAQRLQGLREGQPDEVPRGLRKAGKERAIRWRMGRALARAWAKASVIVEWGDTWVARTPVCPALSGVWRETALELAECLGAHRTVVECGVRLRTMARSTDAWLGVAMLEARHFGEDGRAREAMQEAESAAWCRGDWADCAEAWQVLFGEEAAADRCAQRAESLLDESRADACAAWIAAARARAAAGVDLEPVRTMLERAVRHVLTPWDRVELATAWVDLAGDRREAERVLQAAENGRLDPCDWFVVGLGWARGLRDLDIASRCLEQGGKLAKRTFDWVALARATHELGGDPAIVLDCVERAAGSALTVEDWCWVADVAFKLLEVPEFAGECHRKAVGGARSLDEWLCCARSAVAGKDASDLLLEAEKRASTSLDHRRCADAWILLAGDSVRARRSLEHAEAKARTGFDQGECSAEWDRLCMDATARRRCEKAAERMERGAMKTAVDGTTTLTFTTQTHSDDAKPA